MRWYVLVVLLISLLLRIYDITENPPGFFCDEALHGYEACAVLRSGMDSYGERYPLFPRGFGWGINPVYFWMLIPSVYIFGKTIMAVRITSAICGSLTVLFLYLSVKKIFDERTALISALLLCFNPWHLHFSRIGFEAITAPLFLIISLYFAISQDYRILWPVISAITFYTYGTARPLSFILFFALLKVIDGSKRKKVFYSIIFILLILPGVNHYIIYGNNLRFQMVSIFNSYYDHQLENKVRSVFPRLSESRSTGFYSAVFVLNYMEYISPKFLAFSGDNNIRHSPRGYGQLLHIEYLLFSIGLLASPCLYRKFNGRKRKGLLFFMLWFFLSPVPASLTAESVPHAIRSIIMLPVPQIIAALGFSYLCGMKKPWSHVLAVSAVILYTASTLVFLNHYFIAYPDYSYLAWQYGTREAIGFVEKNYRNSTIYLSHYIFGGDVFARFFTDGCGPEHAGRIANRYKVCNRLPCNGINIITAYDSPVNARRSHIEKIIRSPDGRPVLWIIYHTG